MLAQRLGEWVGHGPVLEEDIALTNVGLDLLGQARLWLALRRRGRGARSRPRPQRGRARVPARCAGDFRNLLLVEQPNGNYADTMARQFYFDHGTCCCCSALARSRDERIAEIAAKARQGSAYHVERSADWVMRLGDGTDESHARMQAAIDDLWTYTGEMFAADAIEHRADRAPASPPDARARCTPPWRDAVAAVLGEATLTRAGGTWMHGVGGRGGKQGVHTEHLGHLLAEMQFLQRAYPGATLVIGAAEHGDRCDGGRAAASAARDRRRAPRGHALAGVPDPEMPVVSIVELGIVRDVRADGGTRRRRRHADVLRLPGHRRDRGRSRAALAAAGVDACRIETRARRRRGRPTGWRRRRATQAARVRHRAAGRAPRASTSPASARCAARRVAVPCPRCGSTRTRAPVAVRLDRVQGALPLPRLPRAVRLLQAALTRREPVPSPVRRAVERETRDAVAITFDVPDALRDQFRYAPGQHLTLRADIGGQDVRRSYSICSAVHDGALRIAVKKAPGRRVLGVGQRGARGRARRST